MIRTALFADVDAVITVIASAYSDYVPLLGRNPQPLDDDYDALIAAGDVHVLEEAAAIVGVLVTQSTDDGLLIRTVGILPGVQGKGLGTKLMVFAEQLADDQDVRMLRLYTNEVMTGTVRLYARLGYAETHRKGPEGRQVIYMAKEIAPGRTPWQDIIVTDPATCFGKPRIAGTRHYIDHLLGMIERGHSFDAIIADYPELNRAQLAAMLGFVRDLVAAKRNGLKGESSNG